MNDQEKYYGNYLGVVIQNNDPEKRGRIKVFVPHVTSSLYFNQWTGTDGNVQDKIFNNLSEVENSDLSDVLRQLRTVSPWAEFAGPIFGGNASGRFNSAKGKAFTSNTNAWDQDNLLQGNRPAARFIGNQDAGGIHDGFNDEAITNVLNPYSFEYTPANYSGLAAGVFTIPNVGSHVWVFFQGGNANIPVYWASSYSQADFKRIYTESPYADETLIDQGVDDRTIRSAGISPDYPGEYENSFEQIITPETKTFRAKHVINTNKHSLEFIDTDHKETLKLTHYSGSFKEWNNFTTTELASNNDQKLVLGDQFETVRKSKNTVVDLDRREVVNGDVYERVGNFDIPSLQIVNNILKSLDPYKRLFDMRRTDNSLRDVYPTNAISSLQTRQPGTPPSTGSSVKYTNGFVECPRCQSKDGTDSVNGGPLKDLTDYQYALQYSIGEGVADNTLLGSEAGNGKHYGYWCDVCNSIYLPGPAFRGLGVSPSSENGAWELESRKGGGAGGTIVSVYKGFRDDLNKALAKLTGGDKIVEIHKNKIETIGLLMNTSSSFRVDPIGKLRGESIFVGLHGCYTSGKPSPYVEHVDALEVPGGNYILTASNKFKLLVGAKGINIKTFGPIDMYGAIFNITGEQLNLYSSHEINIDAGTKLFIRADRTSIVSKGHEPVLIDSPLNITRNLIVDGDIFVDGTLYVPSSIFAPQIVKFTPPPNLGFGNVLPQEPIAGVRLGNTVNGTTTWSDDIRVDGNNFPADNAVDLGGSINSIQLQNNNFGNSILRQNGIEPNWGTRTVRLNPRTNNTRTTGQAYQYVEITYPPGVAPIADAIQTPNADGSTGPNLLAAFSYIGQQIAAIWVAIERLNNHTHYYDSIDYVPNQSRRNIAYNATTFGINSRDNTGGAAVSPPGQNQGYVNQTKKVIEQNSSIIHSKILQAYRAKYPPTETCPSLASIGTLSNVVVKNPQVSRGARQESTTPTTHTFDVELTVSNVIIPKQISCTPLGTVTFYFSGTAQGREITQSGSDDGDYITIFEFLSMSLSIRNTNNSNQPNSSILTNISLAELRLSE